MPRRSGPIEDEIRQLVAAHLRKYGHGTATKLGALIGRPSAWIGKFSVGDKQATVDEAITLARKLGARPTVFGEGGRAEPAPVIDPAQAELEARWLRLLHRLQADPFMLDTAFNVCEAFARRRSPPRSRRHR